MGGECQSRSWNAARIYMPNFLADGLTWLHEQRHAKLTDTVSYGRRSGGTLSGLLATPLKSESEQFREEGFAVKASLRDWMFRIVDLTSGGTFTPPVLGDRITEAGGQVWEVAELPGLDGCWRLADTANQAVRVHTKLIGTPIPATEGIGFMIIGTTFEVA